MIALNMSILVYPEDEYWIAQCLEHDICVQAESLAALGSELKRVFSAHYQIARERGLLPFQHIPKAPPMFWEKFRQAKQAGSRIAIGDDLASVGDVPTLVPDLRVIESPANRSREQV